MAKLLSGKILQSSQYFTQSQTFTPINYYLVNWQFELHVQACHLPHNFLPFSKCKVFPLKSLATHGTVKYKDYMSINTTVNSILIYFYNYSISKAEKRYMIL